MVSSELSDQKPGIVTAFRALLIFLLAGGIVVAALFLYRNGNTYDADRSAKRYENLNKLKADNFKKTSEYAVLDKAKGTFQVPLKEAVSLTVKDLALIHPHVAYAVATPAPVEPPKADAAKTAAPAPAAPAPTAATPAPTPAVAPPAPVAAEPAPPAAVAEPTPMVPAASTP